MVNIFRAAGHIVRRHPLFFRLLVVGIIFTVLFFNIHPREILDAYSQAKPKIVVLAIVMTVPNILIQVFKWHYVLGALEPRPSWREAFASVLGGFFLGAASPSRTGELARGVMIPGHSNIRIASLTVVDKGFNQLTVLVVGLLSLVLILPFPLNLIPAACECVLLYSLFHVHKLRPFFERILHNFTHSTTADNALAMFDALSRKKVSGMLVYSIAFYMLYVGQYYVIMLGFTDLAFTTAIKALPLIYLTNTILPITIGDFGIKELAAVKLLGTYGIAGRFALSATLTNNIITFVVPSIAGGLLIAFSSSKKVSNSLSSDTSHEPTLENHRASS